MEDLLEIQHAVYRARGIAHITKTYAKVTFVRGGGAPTGKGAADYYGIWGAAGGRGVVIEAKSTGEDRWYASKIPQHQRDDLQTTHAMGGLALVVLFWESTDDVWVIPWTAIERRLQDHKAWHRGVVEGGAMLVHAGVGPFDYLSLFADQIKKDAV